MGKITEGVMTMASAIMENPFEWLRQTESIIDYWNVHKDEMPPEKIHDLARLLRAVKIIKVRMDLMEVIYEEEFEIQYSMLCVDLFTAQMLISRLDPKETKE